MTAEMLPQAVEAEIAVLGAVMIDNSALPVVAGILEPSDFFRPAHRLIYSAMIRLAERSEPVDMATVSSELEKTGNYEKCGGPTAIIDIADSVYTSANAPAHAALIRDTATLRRLIEHSNKLRETCLDHPGDVAKLVADAADELAVIGRRGEGRKPTNEAVCHMMNTVERHEIDWMWQPWMPLGSISILEGDPKVGKSSITFQLAAIVSRGWGFPDCEGRPGASRLPANVIVMNSEDPPDTVIGPRLDHADADSSRIALLTAVKFRRGVAESERMVTLQDVDVIEREVQRLDAKLVIVDPIQAYFGASVDMHRANETRPVLAALGLVAARQQCAILLVRHLRKMGGSATSHGLGGVDIFGYARSIMLAWKDPDDPDRRILAHTSTNFAREAKSLVYGLDGGFRWCGIDDRTAEQLSSDGQSRTERAPAMDAAAEWLKKQLSAGPLAANDITARARREKVGLNTLRQTKSLLGIESYRSGGIYFWKLPTNENRDA